MYLGYVLAPFVGWTCAGTLKFLVNSLRSRTAAFHEIGYGGFPSTHTAVVATPAATILFRERMDNPALSVAVSVVVIVALDAMSLRRRIGEHASILNRLSPQSTALRERLGHRPHEVLGGLGVGGICGFVLGRFL